MGSSPYARGVGAHGQVLFDFDLRAGEFGLHSEEQAAHVVAWAFIRLFEASPWLRIALTDKVLCLWRVRGREWEASLSRDSIRISPVLSGSDEEVVWVLLSSVRGGSESLASWEYRLGGLLARKFAVRCGLCDEEVGSRRYSFGWAHPGVFE